MALIANTSAFLNRLDYTNLNTLEQALIDRLITAFTKEIEAQCNRVFAAANYTEKHDGDGERNILVKNIPLNTLTSITVTSSKVTVVNSTDFTFDPLTGEIRWKDWDIASTADFVGFFPIGFQNISISYNGGYTTIPDDLEMLCAEGIIQVFDRKEAVGQVQSEKMGQEYYSYGLEQFRNLVFTHKKTLSRYRRHYV